MSVNREAIFIWSLTENQFIMGMGGPIGLNHIPVWQAIEKYRVRDPRDTFEKVLRLHQEVTMELVREEIDKSGE